MAQHATASKNLQLLASSELVSVQLPLPVLGALANAENAFFDLCVRVGRDVFDAMMEHDRAAVCGPKGKHDRDRDAVRAGSTSAEITLGGRRIGVRRLRARGAQGEIPLPSFVFAANRDPLDRHTMEAIACGVSTRKYRRSLERLSSGQQERATSKSSVSRRFVALSRQRMTELLSVSLADLDLRVIVRDGIVFRDRTVLIVLGIDSAGNKHVLGIREGTTENQGVARALLRDLLDRGLSSERAYLFAIDGAKGLRAAILGTFGQLAVVQRCQIHKRRNILDHLPAMLHPSVDRVLSEAWSSSDVKLARTRLEKLASSLEEQHPGAAASTREGLEETLTLQRLGIDGALQRTLRSTNTIENLNGSVAHYTKNVKRWRSGSMLMRWVAASVLEASEGFRRIRGYKQLAKLIQALEKIEAAQLGGSKTDSQVA